MQIYSGRTIGPVSYTHLFYTFVVVNKKRRRDFLMLLRIINIEFLRKHNVVTVICYCPVFTGERRKVFDLLWQL